MTQVNTSSPIAHSPVLFKRGSKGSNAPELRRPVGPTNEEAQSISDTGVHRSSSVNGECSFISTDSQVTGDVFTWQHLQYDIPVGKGRTRRLLDDVSGYVESSKLTALMGSSGAGKVNTILSQ